MPFNCDICGDEIPYGEAIIEDCNLGIEHTYCKKCKRRRNLK